MVENWAPGLVTDAVTLAGCIPDAREMGYRYGPFTHAAPPPCHVPMGSMEAIFFGNDPAHPSALIVSCRVCAVPDFHRQLESVLGVRIQTWLSGPNCSRYDPSAVPPPPARAPGLPLPAPFVSSPSTTGFRSVAVAPGSLELNARLGAGPATIAELQLVPCWISARGKRLYTYRAGRRRRLFSWRHSHGSGVALARFGGHLPDNHTGEDTTILPWGSYARLEWLGRRADEVHPSQNVSQPALCLAGDAGTPSDLDWLVLDIDFKPDRASSQKLGLRHKRVMLERASELGCPIFESSSRRGAHILARLSAEAQGHDFGRSMALPVAGDPPVTGITVDRFLPGAKALICLRLDLPYANSDPGHLVPVLSPADVEHLIWLR